jgi:glycerophosphoryl diester phosphodiesterase
MTNPFPRQLVLGHRGARRELPENTLGSLARAVAVGADGVEVDVQIARDGVAVVIHDESLDRTTGITGRVSRLAWPAIQRMTGAIVPSFEQVAAWAAAAGAWLNVEIKAAGVEEAVLGTIRDMDLADRTVLSSFHWTAVKRAGAIEPGIHCFLLLERLDGTGEQALAESGAGGVCLHVNAATDVTLRELDRRGLPVIVWTVNEAERITHLLKLGVAGIITDEPALAAGIRAGRAAG